MKKLIIIILLLLAGTTIKAQDLKYPPFLWYLGQPNTWTGPQTYDSLRSRVIYADSLYQMGVRIDPFPYHKLVTMPSGVMAFRLMVDDSLGNDSNDGLTWATAKKTINGALNTLPSDLKNYEVQVIVQNGVYRETINLNRFFNGLIHFQRFGTNWNSSTSAWGSFWKNGATNPFRNDSTVQIVPPTGNMAFTAYSSGTSLSLIFQSQDTLSNQFEYGRWIFKTSSYYIFESNPLASLGFYGVIFDATGGTWEANAFRGETNLVLQNCSFIGVTGTKQIRISNAKLSSTIQHDSYWKWNGRSPLPYPGKSPVFYDTLPQILCVGLNRTLDFRTAYLVKGGKLKLTLNSDFTGTIYYDTSTAYIVDGSIENHKIASNGNLISNYLTTKFRVVSDTAYISSLKTTNTITGKNLNFLATDSTRTFRAITDSLMVKVNINGIDYWLKLVR